MASAGFNDGSNHSTLSFGGTSSYSLLNMSVTQTAAEIDVSGASEVEKLFVGGQRERKFEAEIVGTPDITVPSTGALTCTFQDGQTCSAATAVCVENSISGSLNGAITSKVAFRTVSA